MCNTNMIDSTAEIGNNVTIEPNVYIGKNVKIGDNVTLRSGSRIEFCEIGEGSEISSFAVIGSPPQDLGYKNEPTKVIIGKNTIIREFATVNRASGEGSETIVGDNCLLMTSSHVAHNCVLDNNVIMANLATIGGHVTVGQYAFLGGMSVYHQNIRIGEMAIVSGMSGCRQDILPYSKSAGSPATIVGLNTIGLKRRGITLEERTALKHAFNILCFEHKYNVTQAIEVIKETVTMNKYVENMLEFAATTKRGLILAKKAGVDHVDE